MSRKINVAIIGLGFGAEFIPIYQNHPHANMYAICQRNEKRLNEIGDAFGVDVRYTRYEDVLADPNVDAVHINTPIPLHAEQSVAGLLAGKHVACTVPMGTSIDELWEIIRAKEQSGKKYMMMETVVYSREFLFVKELRDKGELGRIQFLRGAHHQEMAGWPDYWEGLPPMHYGTHAIGPLLALADREADFVSCFGSGRIADNLAMKYGSPFAVETVHIKLRDSDIAAEATRSLFETAREYIEKFDVYGSKMSFEWAQLEREGRPVIFRGEQGERIEVPDYAHLLPEGIQKYTTQGVYDAEENQHLSFIQGSGHGGSHPHLAHEFIMALVEDREPYPDVYTSANWTATGLCAHQSAMRNGMIVPLPDFRRMKSRTYVY